MNPVQVERGSPEKGQPWEEPAASVTGSFAPARSQAALATRLTLLFTQLLGARFPTTVLESCMPQNAEKPLHSFKPSVHSNQLFLPHATRVDVNNVSIACLKNQI